MGNGSYNENPVTELRSPNLSLIIEPSQRTHEYYIVINTIFFTMTKGTRQRELDKGNSTKGTRRSLIIPYYPLLLYVL